MYGGLLANRTIEELCLKDDGKYHVIHDWKAKKVDKNTYFVWYTFYYITNKSDFLGMYHNGVRIYCYEVNLQTGIVQKIKGTYLLEKKYSDLEYID